jgi:antitoxin PrlF
VAHAASCPRHITVVMYAPVALAHSRLTAQGQISVPAEVRKRLGIGPGAVLEWDEENGNVIVRRAGRFSSEDIHRALFRRPPEAKSLEDLKEGARRYVRGRHAGR